MNTFNYYSKEILNGMNQVEDLTGKTKMFHELLPDFEKNFWAAHDNKNVKVLKTLKSVLDKIIDDLNTGTSFLK